LRTCHACRMHHFPPLCLIFRAPVDLVSRTNTRVQHQPVTRKSSYWRRYRARKHPLRSHNQCQLFMMKCTPRWWLLLQCFRLSTSTDLSYCGSLRGLSWMRPETVTQLFTAETLTQAEYTHTAGRHGCNNRWIRQGTVKSWLHADIQVSSQGKQAESWFLVPGHGEGEDGELLERGGQVRHGVRVGRRRLLWLGMQGELFTITVRVLYMKHTCTCIHIIEEKYHYPICQFDIE